MTEEFQNKMLDFMVETRANFSAIDAKLGDLGHGLNRVEKAVVGLDLRLGRVETRLDRLEVKVDDIDARLTRVEEKVDRIEVRLDRVEVRLDNVEERLDNIESEIGSMSAAVLQVAHTVKDHDLSIREIKARYH